MSRLRLLGMVAAVLLWASPVLAQGPTADDIASQLVCQCGCGSVLNNCVHEECSVRTSMYSTIRTMLSEGKSGPEIVQAFVAFYGEEVLSAPTKTGFNLTAWLGPFAALLGGGGLVAFLLRSWAGKGRKAPVKASPIPPKEEEKYRQKLEQELKDFGEGLR